MKEDIINHVSKLNLIEKTQKVFFDIMSNSYDRERIKIWNTDLFVNRQHGVQYFEVRFDFCIDTKRHGMIVCKYSMEGEIISVDLEII